MNYIEIINQILAVLTVVGQAFLLSLIFPKVREFARKNALFLVLNVSIVAMAGSLFYSEIAGYEPCVLCWYQRILMYPMAILSLAAISKRDENILRYTLILSALGIIISAYHYLMQIGAAPAIPCSALGYSSSCSQFFVMNFGYITIPMMSLTAFSMIFATSLIRQKSS